MAEHKVQGGDMLLFIDPNGGTEYDIVVCLTSVGVSDSVSVVDASSACGPDKSPGTLEISYSFEGQHLQDPDTGKISGSDLRILLRNETTIGWMMAPETPVDGDEIHEGTGYLSELSSTYAFDSVGTFTGTIQPYGEPIITIFGGVGGLQANIEILNNTVINGATVGFNPVSASGGTPPYSYAISPSLPSGLSFNTSTGEISGTASGTSPNTPYTITVTDDDANTDSATINLLVKNLAIGDTWEGGLVAYLDGLGGGFVINQGPYVTSYKWGAKVNVTTSSAIGDAAANTAAIEAVSTGVAGRCTAAALANNSGGYTDWKVPTKDELDEILINHNLLGVQAARWSSTQFDTDNAYYMDFFNEVGGYMDKLNTQVPGGPFVIGLWIRYF